MQFGFACTAVLNTPLLLSCKLSSQRRGIKVQDKGVLVARGELLVQVVPQLGLPRQDCFIVEIEAVPQRVILQGAVRGGGAGT